MYPNFLDAKFRGFFSRLLRGALAGKRSALATSLESTRTRTCPAECVTLRVRNGHGGIVEGGPDVSNRDRNISSRSALFALGHGGRDSSV